ncbi:hypothetical protein GA830_12195 [Mesorhizobium sp. NBSH29]|uniref:hypothetical protein n=1 Tax=Mesorhizobium sp. NBSH29 TaxID=2654249 RepID=UPI00189675D0|nr:hypothetical protein [Mesorhizobium sp. NBSH29]QPC87418.1 hypothetical protein GA830_12195 [Mesorhizobium sp. NBSH29]
MAGNAVIGALRVNLGIDTAQFSQGLGTAQSSLAKFGKTVALAAAAAGAAIAGALAVGVKSALNSADEMSKMAAKIGIPIEELSKLKYVADLSGVSLQGLQTSVGKLSKNMADAADGTGEGKKAFDRLGISVVGADGKLKSSSQVMAEISDKFASMPNGAQKTALAMKLMGRAGADMIPLLNGGSAALNGMLLEAKALGLEVSQKTATAAEQFNDNLSRMGYAVTGLTLGLTAALAPALAVISDAMVVFVQWILSAVDYLPVFAEYLAVAGGALAVMFSPMILAAVLNLAVAIKVNLVGAFVALKAAILANPLTAIAVAIAAVIVAVYHFRDAIKQAIGVDVVAIVKGVGNVIVGTFVGAFKAIKSTWSTLPAALGDLGYKGANKFIDAMNWMVGEVVAIFNGLIAKINGGLRSAVSALGGDVANAVQLGDLGSPQSYKSAGIKNPYAGVANDVGSKVKSAFNDAYANDYIGGIAKSFSGLNTGLTTTSDLLDDIGGGGASKAGKAMKDAALSATDPWKGLRKSVDSASEGFSLVKDAASGFFSDFMSNIKSGLGGWASFGEAALGVLSRIGEKLTELGTDSLINGLFSGFTGSGGGGGLLKSLFGGLVGFASGGTILPGGTGGIDSQLVAFRKSPNEQVDITKPGQRSGGKASPTAVNINVRVSGANGNSEIRQMVSAGVREGIDQFSRQELPVRVNQISEDPRAVG